MENATVRATHWGAFDPLRAKILQRRHVGIRTRVSVLRQPTLSYPCAVTQTVAVNFFALCLTFARYCNVERPPFLRDIHPKGEKFEVTFPRRNHYIVHAYRNLYFICIFTFQSSIGNIASSSYKFPSKVLQILRIRLNYDYFERLFISKLYENNN